MPRLYKQDDRGIVTDPQIDSSIMQGPSPAYQRHHVMTRFPEDSTLKLNKLASMETDFTSTKSNWLIGWKYTVEVGPPTTSEQEARLPMAI